MTHHKKPELARRMARIEGHVRGIRKMIEDDKGYPEIVQQVSAVRAALDGVTQVIIQDLVEYYVSQTTDSKGKNVADEDDHGGVLNECGTTETLSMVRILERTSISICNDNNSTSVNGLLPSTSIWTSA